MILVVGLMLAVVIHVCSVKVVLVTICTLVARHPS